MEMIISYQLGLDRSGLEPVKHRIARYVENFGPIRVNGSRMGIV